MKKYITTENDFYMNNTPEKLVEQYGSPLYVYNENILRQRCKELKNLVSYDKFFVNYAAKANSNLAILEVIRSEGLFCEAMSPSEVLIELKAGFLPEQIFYVCNNISIEEMKWAIDKGMLISVDSLSQLEKIGSINKGGKIAIRFNPGIGIGHHEKVITAGKNTKFAVNEEYIPQVKEILQKYNMRLVGINQHVGSLFMESEDYFKCVNNLLQIAKNFDSLEFVDFGGGFGIPYKKLDNQPRLDIKKVGELMDMFIENFNKEYGKKLSYKVEPGRYAVAESGVLLGTVTSKKNNGDTKYIGTDIGFSTFMRPVLYDSHHDIEVYNQETETETVTVVGNICESGDILAANRELQIINEGDIIGVLDAGAYGHVMSSNYNSRMKPAEIMIRTDGSVSVIRTRDTHEDVISHMQSIN